MTRLKFLIFALIALALWGYQITLVSPNAAARGVSQATSAAAGAPAAIALKIEAQRSELQAAALKLAASPAVLNPGPKPGAKVEPPTADRFAAVRTVVTESLGEGNKAQVAIALVNEAGAVVAQGTAEPAAPPEGFNAAELATAGASVAAFSGSPFLFVSVPMLISDKNEVRAGGSVVVGLPLLPDAKSLEAAAKELELSAIGIAADGKIVVSAGADKGSVDGALKALKAGQIAAVAEGAVKELGPLQLPMMVSSLANLVGVRQHIAGTPWDVVAIASARPALESVAQYQVFALGGLVGLFLLTIVVALLLGKGEEEEGAAMVVPPPMPLPPVALKKQQEESAPPIPDHPPAPEASPDDFDFPASSPSQIASQPPPPPISSPSTFAISTPSSMGQTGQAPAFQPEEPEAADPFAKIAPPPPPSYPPSRPASNPPPVQTSQAPAFQPPPPPPSRQPPPASPFDDDEEGARTVAYPAFKPPPAAAPTADPFAMAAGQLSPEEQMQSHDDNPDATRVAAVPQELIKAARSGASGATGERPAMRPPTGALPKVQSVAPVGGAGDEERHFQDVFRDFVATREKCGEAADGLTFDKFKAKLLKNKEQLVAKYACRTVRFQVYVKDGKAALKATPVKD